jgi:hypothetical protein
MLRGLALALVLAATPALACHRFTRWAYPFPQTCGATRASERSPIAVLRQAQDAITLPDMTAAWETPGASKDLWDGIERKGAILKLDVRR